MDDQTISVPIEQPIEARTSTRGKPSAMRLFEAPLNHRQEKLLELLPEYDSRITVKKNAVNMIDLAALTSRTKVEFALFTKGQNRLVIRGDARAVNIDIDVAAELNAQGYKWSGHTHVGYDEFALAASKGDLLILAQFDQDTSVVYNSIGQRLTFHKKGM